MSTTVTRAEATGSARPLRRRLAVAVAAAGLLALVLMLWLGGGGYVPEPAGLPDPGRLTSWALPLATGLALVLGVLVTGALLVPLLTVTAESGQDLRGRGLRAVRAVRPLALGWALAALAALVLTWSDQFAVPLSRFDLRDVYGFARQVDQGQALLVQAALALVVAVSSRWVLRMRESGWLLAGALAAAVPPALTGHAAAAGSHDTAVISLIVHVLAVSVWVGGVVALWWHLGDLPRTRSMAARRFSSVAIWCFGVVAVSGVINALVRLGGPGPLLTSDYGRGVLVKVVLLGGIGLLAVRVRGAHLRSTAVGATEDARGLRPLLVLTAGELALMSAAIGLGVALSRTPPPQGEVYTGVAESLLGGPVPPAPTAMRLLTSFTASGVGLLVVLLGTTAYLVGVVSLRRRGVRWSPLRTIAWLTGMLAVAYATVGGLGVYSHVMFSAHMASHMVLSMMAPILLVLGSPVTLALRALPGTDEDGGRGPRQWLAGVLRSRYVRVITHPIVAAGIFVVSLYGIYFSGLFEHLMESHLGHGFMELHFLLAGCLYYEVLVGDSPIPHRLSHLARLGLGLVVMPFHAFFAIAVMGSSTLIGGRYYELLDRGYATNLLDDQNLGGSLTWALGEVPMVLVLFVLLAQWYRTDTREARRRDRQADRDDEAELTAYNEMLARISGRDGGA